MSDEEFATPRSSIHDTSTPASGMDKASSDADADADPVEFEPNLSGSATPEAGSSYILRSAPNGRFLTLLEGNVVLEPLGSKGSNVWECVQNNDRFGLRNSASGTYLGYDIHGNIVCSADKHKEWEYVQIRQGDEGSYGLFFTKWHEWRLLGLKVDQGVEKLTKIDAKDSDGLRWEFIRVDQTYASILRKVNSISKVAVTT